MADDDSHDTHKAVLEWWITRDMFIAQAKVCAKHSAQCVQGERKCIRYVYVCICIDMYVCIDMYSYVLICARDQSGVLCMYEQPTKQHGKEHLASLMKHTLNRSSRAGRKSESWTIVDWIQADLALEVVPFYCRFIHCAAMPYSNRSFFRVARPLQEGGPVACGGSKGVFLPPVGEVTEANRSRLIGSAAGPV